VIVPAIIYDTPKWLINLAITVESCENEADAYKEEQRLRAMQR